MSKNLKTNLLIALSINIVFILLLFFFKENLTLINLLSFMIAPIIVSVIFCLILNKGKKVTSEDRNKLNIIYFLSNLIYYIFTYFILNGSSTIEKIISQSRGMESEYVSVSNDVNPLLSIGILLLLSFVAHRLIIDKVTEIY